MTGQSEIVKSSNNPQRFLQPGSGVPMADPYWLHNCILGTQQQVCIYDHLRCPTHNQDLFTYLKSTYRLSRCRAIYVVFAEN